MPKSCFSRSLTAAVLFLLSTGVHQAFAAEGEWTALRPEGGYVREFVSGDQLYALSGERVYVSADEGATWALLAELPSNVLALAIDDSDPERMFLGTGHNGIMRSLDGGRSWETVGLDFDEPFDDQAIDAIAITNDGGERIYAGNGAGQVFVSTDGGETWPATDGQPSNIPVSVIMVDPGNSRRVYVATYGGNIFRTDDGGDSWTSLGDFLEQSYGPGKLYINAIAIDPNDSNRIFIGGDCCWDVFRSEDAGETWTTLGNGLPLHTAGLRDITFDPVDSSTMYATFDSLINYVPVYKSLDGGNSWSPLPKPVNGVQGPDGTDLHVAAGNPQLLTLGSGRGIWRSTDGGITWSPSNSGFDNMHVNGVARAASNETRIMAVGRVGNPVISDDAGASWTSLGGPDIPHPDFYSVAINPANADDIWVGQAFEEGLLRSTDGGQTWKAQDIEATSPAVSHIAIYPLDPGVVLAVNGSDSKIHRTTTNGTSWSGGWNGLPVQNYGADFAGAVAMSPTDPEIVYLATALGLFKSIDGGVSWSELVVAAPGESFRAVAVDPVDPDVVYAGSGMLGTYKSTDGGTTWNLLSDAPYAIALAIDPDNGADLLAASPYDVYASTDGGETWAIMDAGLTRDSFGNLRATDLLFDPVTQDRYYLASNGVLYVYEGALPKPDADDTGGDDDGDDNGGDGNGSGSSDGGASSGGGGGGALGVWLLFGIPAYRAWSRRRF